VTHRLYGGIGETQLRDQAAGAPRGTEQRAIGQLLDEVDDLREALRLLAHRIPWEERLCWCHCAPFDNGSTKDWDHDHRCTEIRELLDE
jgi:hypothetical protein